MHATRYRPVDVGDPASVARVVAEAAAGQLAAAGGEAVAPVAAYLALPPSLFAPTIRSLCTAGLPPGSRVVVEKPFGEDLDGAVGLNALLARAAAAPASRPPSASTTSWAWRACRTCSGCVSPTALLEPVWNSAHIEQVDIVWEETLGLEGRAGYYDHAGQLRDMIQNHLLQVLCLTAMEPPTRWRSASSGTARSRSCTACGLPVPPRWAP